MFSYDHIYWTYPGWPDSVTVVVETEVVVATDVPVLVAVVVVTDVAVVVAMIFFVTVVVANLVVVRISVTNSASPESVETVVQTVEDSQSVLGTAVVSGVVVTANVLETVSLTVEDGGEETVQVFVAVSLLVRPLSKVKRSLEHELPHTIENRQYRYANGEKPQDEGEY